MTLKSIAPAKGQQQRVLTGCLSTPSVSQIPLIVYASLCLLAPLVPVIWGPSYLEYTVYSVLSSSPVLSLCISLFHAFSLSLRVFMLYGIVQSLS